MQIKDDHFCNYSAHLVLTILSSFLPDSLHLPLFPLKYLCRKKMKYVVVVQ